RAQDGLLAIKVQFVDRGELPVDPIAQLSPPPRIAADRKTSHRCAFTGHEFIRRAPGADRVVDQPGKELQQQLLGCPVGVFRLGAGELIRKSIEPSYIEPRNLLEYSQNGAIEREPIGIGELDRAADAALG